MEKNGGIWLWKWLYNKKRDREVKFMVLDQEWVQNKVEKYCLKEEKKEEKNLLFNCKWKIL